MKKKNKKELSLFNLRTDLGWTQDDMASVLNLTRGHYAMYESNKRSLSADLQRLVAILQPISRSTDDSHKKKSTSVYSEQTQKILQDQIFRLEKHVYSLNRRISQQIRYGSRRAEALPRMFMQYEALKILDAPMSMCRGLQNRILLLEQKSQAKNPAEQILWAAKQVGKKAELDYLKAILKKSGKNSG
jgi:transcriptional regulator with XRE-family HTH domain